MAYGQSKISIRFETLLHEIRAIRAESAEATGGMQDAIGGPAKQA
jgi:hypothetical protein